MKNLRQLCAAVLLTLAFTLSAYADDGHASCPAVTTPAPPATVTGEIPFPGLLLAESLIQGLLSLS